MYRRLVNWLAKSSAAPELRRASRFFEPSVDVYYWDGSAPIGHQLRDVSATGAYLYTSERWYPGTIVRLLLQEKPAPETVGEAATAPVSLSVPAKVVWQGPDGVALQFMFRTPEDQRLLAKLIAAIPKQPGATVPSGGERQRD